MADIFRTRYVVREGGEGADVTEPSVGELWEVLSDYAASESDRVVCMRSVVDYAVGKRRLLPQSDEQGEDTLLETCCEELEAVFALGIFETFPGHGPAQSARFCVPFTCASQCFVPAPATFRSPSSVPFRIHFSTLVRLNISPGTISSVCLSLC